VIWPFEPWLLALVSLAFQLVFSYFALRAFSRTRNPGFLLLFLVFIVVPQTAGLVERRFIDWYRDHLDTDATFAQSLQWVVLLRAAIVTALLSTALVLLARHDRGSRRLSSEER
jgi:hypothetical protein